MEKVPEDLCFY